MPTLWMGDYACFKPLRWIMFAVLETLDNRSNIEKAHGLKQNFKNIEPCVNVHLPISRG